ADGLSDSAECHDEFAEAGTVNVGHVSEVEQDAVMPVGNFFANRAAQGSQSVAGGDTAGKVEYRYSIRASFGKFKIIHNFFLAYACFSGTLSIMALRMTSVSM